MGTICRNLKRWRIQVLGGVVIPLFVPFGLGSLTAQTLATPAQLTAPVLASPAAPMNLADCLTMAMEQQPALAAHRASLSAAHTQSRGLNKMILSSLISRDLPIRRKQACLGVSIAEAGLTQAEWDTIYAVKRTYMGVIYARDQLKVATDLVGSLRFYQERVRELVKEGKSREWTTSTVDKITVYLRLAETRQAEATRGIDRATAALREAIGIGPEVPLQIADEHLPTGSRGVNKDEIIALAVGRRGELMQAISASEVVELEARAQGTKFLPVARTFACAVDIHARPVPQGFSNGEYRPGATSLEMPTTFAGPRSERIQRARDFGARAAAVVDKTRNLVALDAEDAYLKWEEAARKVPQTRDAAEAGNRLSRTTREDFTAGQKVRIEDILTNAVLAAQAVAAYHEALYEQAIGLAGLQRVTAGGFDDGLGKSAAH